tara:strand:- start:3094 stop:3843 length:750 start_codon:yes stop_codon:yes gene_type:complete
MCAWKYPQEWFKDGDIIEPSDWRLNHQEYLGEVNGQLDNDNFYKKLFTVKQFRQGTFNTFYKHIGFNKPSAPEPYYKFNHTLGGWMSRDTNGEKLPSVTINATEDGVITVDTNVIQNWMSQGVEAPGGGFHIIPYSYWRPRGVRSQATSALILCGMYRVTCNGLSVCETGPIGNEYVVQPIYLCGSIPVSAGQNKVQLEARYVWYSPVDDKYVEASAKNPTSISPSDEGNTVRQDVSVEASMYVNHRKR